MGILDIFYNEVNRWRDKLGSEEGKREIIKKALKKSLAKFNFLWEDQILGGAYKTEQIKPQFEIFSEEFMDLAVEVNDALGDEEITQNLREISKAFRVFSKSPRSIGGYFNNPIPGEIVEALEKIRKINKNL